MGENYYKLFALNKIVVFINFYNFNFVVFSLLIQHYQSSSSRGVAMIKYSEICSKFPGEH